MDAQNFRSLQEAYMEVYGEAYKPFPKEKVDKKMASKVVKAAKHQFSATWGNPSKSSENQEKADKLGSQAKKLFQTSTETNKEANARSRGIQSKHRSEVKRKIRFMDDIARQKRESGYGNATKQEEQVNFYDIILSHLLDEGYAETIESAEAIMVNMSEDWRYHILEEVLDEENERGQRRAAARNMIDRHRTMTKGVSPEDRTGPEGYLRHRAKTERPTTLRNTSSAGQRRAAARNAIDRSATMSKGVSPEDRTGPEGYLRHRAKTGG